MKSLLINTKHRPKNRAAMTLVELMFVILIMLVLATVAIPSVRFLTSDREIREATRVLNSFVDSARNDALANGRAGVWFERSDLDPNKSVRIFKVKYPARYKGDISGALCYTDRVNFDDGVPDGIRENSVYVEQSENSLMSTTLNGVRAGDEIQVGDKGWWYTITEIWAVSPSTSTPQIHPVSGTPAYRIHFDVRFKTEVIHEQFPQYKIRRQPIKRSSLWIDMPKNTFVDLASSGFGVRNITVSEPGHLNGGGNEFSSDSGHAAKSLPVILSFKSDGQIEKIYTEYYNGAGNIQSHAAPPPASLFFLVAVNKEEDTANPINNLETMVNRWLSVSRGTGKVTTSEMAVTNGGTPSRQRSESREFARTAIAQGGS